MKVKYVCPLITVADIVESREFYENVLKQEVEVDHGANIAFKGGFAIHDLEHFQGLTGHPIKSEKGSSKDFMELYFESEEIEKLEEKLKSLNIEFLHGIVEQPWGQRVMRFYDPDNYVIEVGEPLDAVVKRMAHEGLNEKEIAERSSIPLEFVQMMLK
jgi:catechol 2,3-dioxygenase-like lactoylglutathione lyase family enzyme